MSWPRNLLHSVTTTSAYATGVFLAVVLIYPALLHPLTDSVAEFRGCSVRWRFTLEFLPFRVVTGLYLSYTVVLMLVVWWKHGRTPQKDFVEVWAISTALGVTSGLGVRAFYHYQHCIHTQAHEAAPFYQNFFLPVLGIQLASLATYHFGEYAMAAWFQPVERLDRVQFMFNPTPMFLVAYMGAWVEFIVEVLVFPTLKLRWLGYWCVWMGVAMAAVGDFIRKLGLFTAGANFTVVIAWRKLPTHQLVTTGIYAWIRHPGYAGWFLWAVGQQLVLCNPVCLVGFIYILWNFFDDRIRYEEVLLLDFFGEAFGKYRNAVRSGVPWVP